MMTFDEKASVISTLWIEFRKDEAYSDFMSYNDIGCPLAYNYTNGLATTLSDQGIKMIEETFAMFLDIVDVTEDEIDAVLPDKNLGAILVFSHMKKSNSKNGSSAKIGNSSTKRESAQKDFDEDNPNRGDAFSHYAHAFNALTGSKFHSIEEITEFAGENIEELKRDARQEDPEALAISSVIYCTDESAYKEAHNLAKRALDSAEKKGFPLGPYYFAYGFALEQVNEFYDALDMHEEALALGFGAAAFNLGRLLMIHNLDLGGAVRTWKQGRDIHKDYVCREMLSDLEISPGIYQATVTTEDGSTEILMVSDKAGGLGTFR
jgi:tetratricopeptide (TPR) repeat protein